jgi:hypothetical protein
MKAHPLEVTDGYEPNQRKPWGGGLPWAHSPPRRAPVIRARAAFRSGLLPIR